MKTGYLINILLILLVLLFNPFDKQIEAKDIQLGGQLDVSLQGFCNNEIGFAFQPQANLDLELFLPRWKNNEIKCAGTFYTNITENKIDFFWKRLYWKHRFEHLHLTIGRQPVSWSFGSLLNPVDYTLGSVAMDEEFSSKYQDAVEIYIPVNWNTNLSVVASLPDATKDLKAGLRGRTLIKDFDLTFNYVQEQPDGEKGIEKRFGITAKGDIGKFGVYGAFGFYWNRENQFSLLAGADYSYFFQKGNRLYLQAEYLNIPTGLLSQITGQTMLVTEEYFDKNMHLFVSNISYQIDDFSSISLTSFFNCSNGSKMFMSSYINQIKNNTALEIKAGLASESTKYSDINSSPLNLFPGESYQLFLEAGISYVF